MVDNPFEPIQTSGQNQPQTAKPDAPIRPDATNPDTNANVGEDKVNLTSRTAVEGQGQWPKPLDPSKFGGQESRTGNQSEDAQRRDAEEQRKARADASAKSGLGQNNFNPNPVTAGSAEDVERSAGKYDGDVKPGMFIKVSPLNASDEDFVVGKVTGLDVSGLGQMVYLDESATAQIASFHAEDAEILYDPPSRETGRRIFINDDKTYDARELRMERPRNEKQPVEKQNVLRDQTAKSQFNTSLRVK